MSNFTEQAIRRAFVELLNERPFDKVTVLDIAERCGINRNTFYYHYHDVYELLDSVLGAEEERIWSNLSNEAVSWRDCIFELTKWARENETAIKNIYRSMNRDRVENYIFETSQRIMERYVRYQAAGLALDEQTIGDVAFLYAATVEGVLLNWLREGMHEDLEDFIDRMAPYINSNARSTLEKAAQGKGR